MTKTIAISLAILAVSAGAFWLLAGGGGSDPNALELLNVSYDPTRELWRDLNASFIPRYQQQTGKHLMIKQSHGASGSQARAVIDGLEADVVTLAQWSDTDAIRRKGLIDTGWEDRLPHHALPYYSTIVFVVRKGNPKAIRDWPDLIQPGVSIITPNPRTSGNGKLSFLAAWGAVRQAGGSEEEARAFVTRLYRQTPVLDTGARGATVTFAQRRIGDVHLTWENEAYLEVAEARGELEIVYPTRSIRAEPHVAVVDANARRRGTQQAAEAYLKFLYSDEAQEIIGRHHYRPINPEIRKKYTATQPDLSLFPITACARDWYDVQQKFFADGAVFDQIFKN
jgi:sulfate/thiosulfate transport system substrate-binding protein